MAESCKPFFGHSDTTDNSQILGSEIIGGIGEDCDSPIFLGHDTDSSQLRCSVEEEVEENEDLAWNEDTEYKIKYRKAKTAFRVSVETHQFLKTELRHNQQELKTLQEDKFFLLERMLLYEKPVESPDSNEGSDSEHETEGSKKSKKAKPNPGGVTISSAFSKMKSFTAGRKNRKSKLKCAEDVFESPSDSMSRFEDESCSLGAVGFSFSQQEESD